MIFRPIRFALALVGFSALIFLIGFVADRFFGVALSSSGTSVVPILVASMMEGQAHAGKAMVRPAKSAMWGAALRMALIALGVSLIPLAILYAMDPALSGIIAEVGPMVAVIGLCIGLGLSVVISRLGYGLGVRSEMKRQERFGK